jgi:AAHS family 4-hydroxybenzoate transporter-like MFS transporter
MPTLVQESGASLRQATLATSLLSLGGIVGAFGVGWLMDRFERNGAVALAFVVGGVSVWMIGQQTSHPILLPIFIFFAGVGLNGAMFSMGGLAAMFYPASARSAGVAWMYGVGPIGGILGPITGGVLLRTGGGADMSFTLLMVTVLVPAVALWVKRRAASQPNLPAVSPAAT